MKHQNGVTALCWSQRQMVRLSYAWTQQGKIKVLIRPIHKVSTLNGIISTMAGVNYLMLIHLSSGSYNVKPNEQ